MMTHFFAYNTWSLATLSTKTLRRQWHNMLLQTGIVAIMLLLIALPTRADGELNIYNWSDYIGPDTIDNFIKKHGIKVRYDNFDSNETLHAKLVAGSSGYDIVVPSAAFAKKQIDGGLFQPLDRSKITNYKNLDPILMKKLAAIDPDNRYLIPWAWGYTTLGINVGMVKKALGGQAIPKNTWDLLFKPELSSKLKSCGISLLDSASEILPVALHYLGKKLDSDNKEDYKAAGKLLKSIRNNVTLFSSSGYINELASGQVCVAVGWSGDIAIAKNRAIENKNGHDIQVMIPSIGGILFYDVMAIPADSKNVNNAHEFINYYLEPKVTADMTNEVYYANPNPSSLPFIDEIIANDRTVFLEPKDLDTMAPATAIPEKMRRLQTRTFTSFKSGL